MFYYRWKCRVRVLEPPREKNNILTCSYQVWSARKDALPRYGACCQPSRRLTEFERKRGKTGLRGVEWRLWKKVKLESRQKKAKRTEQLKELP